MHIHLLAPLLQSVLITHIIFAIVLNGKKKNYVTSEEIMAPTALFII